MLIVSIQWGHFFAIVVLALLETGRIAEVGEGIYNYNSSCKAGRSSLECIEASRGSQKKGELVESERSGDWIK